MGLYYGWARYDDACTRFSDFHGNAKRSHEAIDLKMGCESPSLNNWARLWLFFISFNRVGL